MSPCLVLDESQRCDHVHEHIVSSMPVCILRFSINTISICGTVLQLHVHVQINMYKHSVLW